MWWNRDQLNFFTEKKKQTKFALICNRVPTTKITVLAVPGFLNYQNFQGSGLNLGRENCIALSENRRGFAQFILGSTP